MKRLALLAPLVLAATAHAQGTASDAIRINQVGFAIRAPKVAVVVDSLATRFAVLGAAQGDTVFRGTLGPPRAWEASGEVVRLARFDGVRRPGRYVLAVPGVGRSHPFVVDSAPLRDLARAALKAFYYQRVSEPLAPAHAGPWARPAGHPDDAVRVHPSAATAQRPAGTAIRAPGGWYDAGDYNKYVVNSGISTSTLLSLVEHYPAYADSLDVAIPERGGALPDALDEALVNLRWMLAMQDPHDGGVYHKLTNAEFDAMDAMPHTAAATTAPRWVVQKSTAAALDLAAVAAQAARVARRYPRALPLFSDTLLRAARDAWAWAQAHPDSTYDQPRLNERYRPAINTGAYGDARLADERRWAAAELWLATRDDRYRAAALAASPGDSLTVPSWASVGTLGLYALLEHRDSLPRRAGSRHVRALERALLRLARPLAERARTSAYATPMGAQGDFVWGSSAVAANQGIVLVHAWRLTGDPLYLDAARSAMDYLLGRNATGYSFVTGFGGRTPRFPHHRPSAGDTVVAPVPGMLAGGPNPGQQDKCAGYPSALPARAYVDSTCSYASNEIAINWNAPLAWLAAALDAADRAAVGLAAEGPRPNPPRRRADVLRADEFENRSWANLYDVVSTLRANWLHGRGSDTIHGDPTDVKVIFDGQPIGDVSQLRNQSVVGIVFLQRFDPVVASARWGLGYGKGAIYVSTRNESTY